LEGLPLGIGFIAIVSYGETLSKQFGGTWIFVGLPAAAALTFGISKAVYDTRLQELQSLLQLRSMVPYTGMETVGPVPCPDFQQHEADVSIPGPESDRYMAQCLTAWRLLRAFGFNWLAAEKHARTEDESWLIRGEVAWRQAMNKILKTDFASEALIGHIRLQEALQTPEGQGLFPDIWEPQDIPLWEELSQEQKAYILKIVLELYKVLDPIWLRQLPTNDDTV
jgi:hypothetical protein